MSMNTEPMDWLRLMVRALRSDTFSFLNGCFKFKIKQVGGSGFKPKHNAACLQPCFIFEERFYERGMPEPPFA